MMFPSILRFEMTSLAHATRLPVRSMLLLTIVAHARCRATVASAASPLLITVRTTTDRRNINNSRPTCSASDAGARVLATLSRFAHLVP